MIIAECLAIVIVADIMICHFASFLAFLRYLVPVVFTLLTFHVLEFSNLEASYDRGEISAIHSKYGKVSCTKDQLFIARFHIQNLVGGLLINNRGIKFQGKYKDMRIKYNNYNGHDLLIKTDTVSKKYLIAYKDQGLQVDCDHFDPGIKNLKLTYNKLQKEFAGYWYDIKFTGRLNENLEGVMKIENLKDIKLRVIDGIIHLSSPDIFGSIDLKNEQAAFTIYDHYVKFCEKNIDITGDKIALSINTVPTTTINGLCCLYEKSLLNHMSSGSTEISIACENFQKLGVSLIMNQTKSFLYLVMRCEGELFRIRQSDSFLEITCSELENFKHLISELPVVKGRMRVLGSKINKTWTGTIGIKDAQLSQDYFARTLLWDITGTWTYNDKQLTFHLNFQSYDAHIQLVGFVRDKYLHCQVYYLNYNSISRFVSNFTKMHFLSSKFTIAGKIGQTKWSLNKFTALYGWIAHLPL